MKKYKHIEIVGSAVIENSKKEILLVRHHKWGKKWVMPGGHIELGETIEQAIKREAEEETGLKNLKSCGIVCYGELINPKSFHRPAHFIYFDVLFKIKDGEVRLDKRELKEYKWVKPKKALKMALGEDYDKVIKDYLKHSKCFT
jgi:nucleoside triphosphatase